MGKELSIGRVNKEIVFLLLCQPSCDRTCLETGLAFLEWCEADWSEECTRDKTWLRAAIAEAAVMGV